LLLNNGFSWFSELRLGGVFGEIAKASEGIPRIGRLIPNVRQQRLEIVDGREESDAAGFGRSLLLRFLLNLLPCLLAISLFTRR
jgi:hypothetical protein